MAICGSAKAVCCSLRAGALSFSGCFRKECLSVLYHFGMQQLKRKAKKLEVQGVPA